MIIPSLKSNYNKKFRTSRECENHKMTELLQSSATVYILTFYSIPYEWQMLCSLMFAMILPSVIKTSIHFQMMISFAFTQDMIILMSRGKPATKKNFGIQIRPPIHNPHGEHQTLNLLGMQTFQTAGAVLISHLIVISVTKVPRMWQR